MRIIEDSVESGSSLPTAPEATGKAPVSVGMAVLMASHGDSNLTVGTRQTYLYRLPMLGMR